MALPPTEQQIAVAIEAIRKDAQKWSDMATTLSEARAAAGQLDLNAFHFTGFGHFIGLDRVYAELQHLMSSLLSQGARNFGNIAGALRTAADAYEREDDAGVHRIQGTY